MPIDKKTKLMPVNTTEGAVFRTPKPMNKDDIVITPQQVENKLLKYFGKVADPDEASPTVRKAVRAYVSDLEKAGGLDNPDVPLSKDIPRITADKLAAGLFASVNPEGDRTMARLFSDVGRIAAASGHDKERLFQLFMEKRMDSIQDDAKQDAQKVIAVSRSLGNAVYQKIESKGIKVPSYIKTNTAYAGLLGPSDLKALQQAAGTASVNLAAQPNKAYGAALDRAAEKVVKMLADYLKK